MKKTKLLLSVALMSAILMTGYSQTFKEVKINNQIWMSVNLNVAKFRNGDTITQAKTNAEWIKAGENKQPAWCYYNNDPANGAKYGKLYNWYAVIDPRGLAPKFWHVPSKTEWNQLINDLGGKNVAGNKMKSTAGWKKYGQESGNGTNTSNFSGLPGGCRWYTTGEFLEVGATGTWWSSTGYDDSPGIALTCVLTYDVNFIIGANQDKEDGYSVRCIKD